MNIISFYVRGRGPFPVDMLRRDQAWPEAPDDAAKIALFDDGISSDDMWRKSRTVKLCGVSMLPNFKRWASFCWEVVDSDGNPIRDMMDWYATQNCTA